MLREILKSIFSKQPDVMSVKIENDGCLIMVRLFVNNRRAAWMQCVAESGNSILIGDILHNPDRPEYNKGYGSMMMEKLLEYARERKFSYIYGNLAAVDLDHKDRLHHFYQKFGFVITEYPTLQGNYYGKIEMSL